MARPRNNITKLPREIRLRVFKLLDDGVEYNDIRNDSEISASCAERGLTIHNTSILAFCRGDEYQEYVNEIKKRNFEKLGK